MGRPSLRLWRTFAKSAVAPVGLSQFGRPTPTSPHLSGLVPPRGVDVAAGKGRRFLGGWNSNTEPMSCPMQ